MNQKRPNTNDLERSIRETLTRERIGSLDELVTRVASSTANRDQEEDHLFSLAERPREERSPEGVNEPHQQPQALLFIDNERCEPEQINEFDGHALYSTPGFDAKREPALYSFTDPSKLSAHLAAMARRDDVGTTNPDSLPEVAFYFEHPDQQGDWLYNRPGLAWRNLTRVRKGFLGIVGGVWNDIISSVDWCRWDISLYEHADYQGSQLYLRAGTTYNNLSDWGWNERASSTVNWGRRF